MGKEWTDEEVQKEISDAVQIVRADKIDALIRNRLSANPANPPNPSDNPPPPSGNGDPSNPGNPDPNVKKRGSLFWGDAAS